MTANEQPAAAAGPSGPRGGFANRAASGSIWTTAQVVVNKAATVVAMLLLARWLSPADFGLANLAASIGAFTFLITPVAMGDVLLARPREFDRLAGSALAMVAAIAIVLFVGLSASSGTIEHISQREGIAILIIVAALRPVADAILVLPNTRLRLDLSYRTIAKVDGVVIFGATLLGLAMARLGYGAMSLTLPPIAVLAVRGVVYWFIVGSRIPLRVERSGLRELASRLSVAGLGQYLNNVIMISEVLVLGLFASEQEIGLFGLAFQLATQANAVIALQLGAVLQPIFGHMADDPQRQVAGFVRATRLLSSVAVPISVMQAVLALPLFAICFDERWQGAIAIFVALSIGQTFMFVSAPSIALLKAQDRFGTYLRWQLGQVIGAAVLFVGAAALAGDTAISAARAIGLPATDDSGHALAVAIASATVWAVSCPIAVWLGGRPAGLPYRSSLRIFVEPWMVMIPIGIVVLGARYGLLQVIPAWWAEVVTLCVLGPVAVLAGILGSARIHADTWTDLKSQLGRFARRRAEA